MFEYNSFLNENNRVEEVPSYEVSVVRSEISVPPPRVHLDCSTRKKAMKAVLLNIYCILYMYTVIYFQLKPKQFVNFLFCKIKSKKKNKKSIDSR